MLSFVWLHACHIYRVQPLVIRISNVYCHLNKNATSFQVDFFILCKVVQFYEGPARFCLKSGFQGHNNYNNVKIIQPLIYFCTALSFKEKENWLNLLKISLIVEILWTATMRKIIRYSILYHQAVVCNFFCSLSDWYRKPYQLRRIFTVIQSLAPPPQNK